ncbi:FliH/SctL family protein [Alicyclobacillus sp.]|uniref:FliH/SctL family protein n=1 Tax=Alicyclobacillus sp. TaxID=61169 RepID=UPI0025BFA727|nr:FliH/SctL family protein [Alicyclobacillus sp.]
MVKWWETVGSGAGAARIPVVAPVVPVVRSSAERSDPARTDPAREERMRAEMEARLEAARQEAEALLDQARAQAEALLADASRQREAIAREAQEAGFAAGMAEGRDAAERELQQRRMELEAAWTAAIDALAEERRRLWESLPDALGPLVMEAVRRLVARELQTSPADVGAMISELLRCVSECTRAEVHVHPSEYDAAVASQPRWRLGRLGEWEVAIIPDPQMAPGGVEIRSDRGRVDARLETRLERLQTVVDEVLRRGGRPGVGPDDG